MDTWEMIAAERAAFADTIAALPEDAWDKPSLNPDWRVRDVVAHMIGTAQMTPPKFIGKMVKSGFNFKAMTTKEIKSIEGGQSPKDLVELYKSTINSRTAPPGPTMSWLGEVIVHGEDVTRSFGSYSAHPIDHVLAVADFYKGSNMLIGSKKRIDGVTLKATDADWSYGEGPVVEGPAIALVLAMTGRKAALDDLSGAGVAALQTRS